ncbi:hypothetical protein [Bacillus cereus group sp. MYBK217-2]|uniref:hypothetical protein n=1 Tax=Bacillus cereus group sp. MYBK217-2 TaxID=3450661 RepID=UPI003F79309B
MKLTKFFLSLLVAQAISGFKIYTFVFPNLPRAINLFSYGHEMVLNIVVLDLPVNSSEFLSGPFFLNPLLTSMKFLFFWLSLVHLASSDLVALSRISASAIATYLTSVSFSFSANICICNPHNTLMYDF